jgi:cysteine desulfurase
VQVYLDNQSNTKLDEKVLEAMMPYFKENYGNPQSIYSLGAVSAGAVETARAQVASFINADAPEIVFTSCGTESNNLALKGAAQAVSAKGKHIIVSEIEHFSVLNVCKQLEKDGFEITYLPVNKEGFVLPEVLQKALKKETVLVSIQLVNTEIGTIQNIKELCAVVKQAGNDGGKGVPLFHTDAVAACGFLKVDVKDLGVDMLTLAANTMYGPKGAAALFIKKGVKIAPQQVGGVQENSRRAGSENVPAIVGFGKACEIAAKPIDIEHITKLRDKLISELPKKIEQIYLNGAVSDRVCNNVNFSIEFVEGEALFLMLDALGVLAASGSSCTSKTLKMSHVLKALGVDVSLGNGSILFTLSKYTTEAEIDYLLKEFPSVVQKLRNMSPLYDYFKKNGKRKENFSDDGHSHDDHCEI